jgi:hypothetical protein
MRRLISSSTLFVALVSCLFILPACDSGGSNSDDGGGGGGGGGGGSGTTVTATSQNSFEFSFTDSGGSSSSAKDPKTYTGFAFAYSGTNPDGEDVYAVYFSSEKTYNTADPTGPEIAGILFALGTQSADGTYSVLDPTNNEISSDQAGGIILKGFDESQNSGTRTIQILSGGDIQFSGGDITGFQSVTANETVFDLDNNTSNSSTVSVSLTGDIDPKEGVPSFVGQQTFTISSSN